MADVKETALSVAKQAAKHARNAHSAAVSADAKADAILEALKRGRYSAVKAGVVGALIFAAGVYVRGCL